VKLTLNNKVTRGGGVEVWGLEKWEKGSYVEVYRTAFLGKS
jgi:hypothetical protein